MKKNHEDEAERKGRGLVEGDPGWERATRYRLATTAAMFAGLAATVAVLRPSRRELRAAFCAGMVTALFDFTIEALAYENDLWYCYGGYQKLRFGEREFDCLHVPADMVAGFVPMGMMTALWISHPERLRRRHRLLRPLLPKALKPVYRKAVKTLLSLHGSNGDFYSKRLDMWENGPGWSYFHCAFLAWYPLITLTLFVYDSLAGE